MYFKKHKKCAFFLSLALMLSATSCGSLPEDYPGIDERPEIIEMGDRFKINFFFQNNENTYCINPNGGQTHNFFEAFSETMSLMSYSDLSKTYTLGYDDKAKKYDISEYNRTEFDNLTWEDAKTEYSSMGKKADEKKSFYVLGSKHDIPMESRVSGGMLSMFLDEVKKSGVVQPVAGDTAVGSDEDAGDSLEGVKNENSSFFDPDAINIMFTDLSEKNITYLGKELNTYYTSDNRYNACVMAVKLEVDKAKGNNKLYFASKDNANSMTPSTPADSRWYYLIMTGPSSDLAVFVQSFVTHLNDMNIKQSNGGFELSDLSFTSENFDVENDVEITMLSKDDPEQQELYDSGDKDSIFKKCLIRLDPVSDKDSVFPVGLKRDEIIEYKYNSSEKVFGLKGFADGKTKDFALNIKLNKEVKSRDLVAESTKLSYVFGDPVVYYQEGDSWMEMDPDHKERFFKLISVDEDEGRSLSIIGDYSDECDIHNIYITVPILQCAEVNQVLSSNKASPIEWVLNNCTFKSSDTKTEAIKTYYFDKFYMNLFDMEIEGSRDENNNEYDEFKKLYSQIDEMKILIEDIH